MQGSFQVLVPFSTSRIILWFWPVSQPITCFQVLVISLANQMHIRFWLFHQPIKVDQHLRLITLYFFLLTTLSYANISHLASKQTFAPPYADAGYPSSYSIACPTTNPLFRTLGCHFAFQPCSFLKMAPSNTDLNAKDYAWETYKDLLRRLWLEDGLKLENIMKYMSEVHNFHAE